MAAAFVSLAFLVIDPRRARAQVAPPAPHDDEAFDVMNVLADHGLHDIHHERWNVYGQLTYISSWKLPFSGGVPYNANARGVSNAPDGSTHSLVPQAERAYTGTLTAFFGVKLWPGAEAYYVPEVVSEVPLSELHGLGGAIQNFELQKGGSPTPQIYRARTFVRQTIGLGGGEVEKTSDPMQLGSVTRARRLVLTGGSFTILDVFDHNDVTGDPRQTFLNMAFMTHGAWDFPADARGYSWGLTGELYWDDWALRVGRVLPPQNPNAASIEFEPLTFYGDALEIEHDHTLFGREGQVKLLGYRNRVDSGAFDEAIAAFQADPTRNNAAACTSYNYGSNNASAPDLCFVRRPNTKVGLGLNVQQFVAPGIGLFVRGMIADGRTEVVAFNSPDRSLSFGGVAKGELWHRPFDVTGIGFASSWVSPPHARYLALGGVDGFVGDGYLRQAPEMVFDAFYSLNMVRAIWLSPDYQLIANPGFNAARGPVHVLSGRVHAEF